jgi:hypothetical protein
MKSALAFVAILAGTLAAPDTAQAQEYLQNGLGRCLHIPQETRANGVQLRTWDCIDKPHLKWFQITNAADLPGIQLPQFFADEFWLANDHTDKCLAVHAGQKHDGAWVVQWDCSVDSNFRWKWFGYGQLMHVQSGKCLHAASGGQYAVATIRSCYAPSVPQYPPGFGWTSSALLGDRSRLQLVSRLRTCLRATGDTVAGMECRTNDESLWAENAAGDGHVSLRNRKTGKCLAIQPGQTQDGAAAVQADCASQSGGSVHWKWLILETPSVRIGALQHRATGKCLYAGSSPISIRRCPDDPPPPAPMPKNFEWRIKTSRGV